MKSNGFNVKQDMPIRWKSTYEILKDASISTLAITNFCKQHLTTNDWKIIEYSCKAPKVFYEVTVDISAENNVTISKISIMSIFTE